MITSAHGEEVTSPLPVDGEEPGDASDLWSGSMPKEEIGALRFLKVCKGEGAEIPLGRSDEGALRSSETEGYLAYNQQAQVTSEGGRPSICIQSLYPLIAASPPHTAGTPRI